MLGELGEESIVPLVAFAAAVLVVSIIVILLIRCCINKCGQSSKKKDVEVTRIGKKDDGEGGGAVDSSRDDRA